MTYSKSAYAAKFKKPKWQKKRLLILERDEWECRICHDDKKTLHVHHLFYIMDCEPWEYPDIMLVTLCADCHEYVKDIDFPKYVALMVLLDGKRSLTEMVDMDVAIFLSTIGNSFGPGKMDLARMVKKFS